MNAICLVIDRLHIGYLGCYGNAWVRTPTFDRLAAEGFIFDQALTDSPRLEEVYQSYWSGVHSLWSRVGRELPSLARELAAAGIATTLVTDDGRVAAHPRAGDFAELVDLTCALPTESARSVEQTQTARLFTAACDTLEAAVTPRSRVLLLNTPWNPAGTVFTRAELSEYLTFAAAHDLYVISDEIYETLLYDGKRHVSPASLSADARGRTVLVNSFSKTYAMTGWRLGYCAGPAPLIAAMCLVLQQASRGPATFVQDAGVAALDGPQDCVAAMRAEYAARRTQVAAALAGLPEIEILLPEGGFFALVGVRRLGIPSDEIRRRLLHEHGVVVVHGSAYGPAGEGLLRVSFASGGNALAQGLERLRTGLTALAAG
jgi:aspartate/methionine/tyrosine aminotransferase